jgi:hypothetical protein
LTGLFSTVSDKLEDISVAVNVVAVNGTSDGFDPKNRNQLFKFPNGKTLLNFTNGKPLGTAIPLGKGVFLTAAHLFDVVIKGSESGAVVNFRSHDNTILGQPVTSINNIRHWSSAQAFTNLGSGKPRPPGSTKPLNDIAIASAPGVSVPIQNLSPLIIFPSSDPKTVKQFFASLPADSLTVTNTGIESPAPTTGSFHDATARGQFDAGIATLEGDSGGSASVDIKNTSYIVGTLSVGSNGSNITQPLATYSFLDPTVYSAINAAIKANGGTLTDFQDSKMAPDLFEGGQKAKQLFLGGPRKVSVISNGDNDVISASGAGGLINKGVGAGVVAFTAAAAGGTDAGTTFVVSPGDETIVGGGPKDKLVLLTDRLWSKSDGMPTPTDVSSSITLKGGYGGPVEGDGDVAAAYSFNSFTATSADTVIGTGLPGDDHVPRTEVNLGTIQDYQYAVNYDLTKNNDLVITLGAFSNPLTPGKNNSLGSVDPLWNSTITIKNYHPGDFGLTFTTDAGKNLPPSQAVAVQLNEDKPIHFSASGPKICRR